MLYELKPNTGGSREFSVYQRVLTRYDITLETG